MSQEKETAATPEDTQSALESEACVEGRLNVEELGALIDLCRQSGVSNFELNNEGMQLKISFATTAGNASSAAAPTQVSPVLSTPAPAPAAQPAPAPPAEPEEVAAEKPGILVESPIVGTFYSSPSPEARSFVEVGDRVKENSVLCIVEAMKIMNEIKAETSGVVAEVMVDNGQPVEYGQPMFRIVPG